VARARPQGSGPRRRDSKASDCASVLESTRVSLSAAPISEERGAGNAGLWPPHGPVQGKRAGALTTAFVRACPDGQINWRRCSSRDGQNVAAHFAGLVFGGIWAAAGTLFLAMSAADAQPNCIDFSAPNAVVVSTARQCRATHVTARCFVAFVPQRWHQVLHQYDRIFSTNRFDLRHELKLMKLN
jgi:hypothetical protein